MSREGIRQSVAVPKSMRRAYERGRVEFALGRSAPILVLALLATTFYPSWTIAGGSLFLSGVTTGLIWRGGRHARTLGTAARVAWVLPLLFAAIEPFGLACGIRDCTVLAGPISGVAGVVGGFLVARHAVRNQTGLVGWVLAVGLVAGAGALGCVCVGAGSTLGLVSGMFLSGLPSLPTLVREPA